MSYGRKKFSEYDFELAWRLYPDHDKDAEKLEKKFARMVLVEGKSLKSVAEIAEKERYRSSFMDYEFSVGKGRLKTVVDKVYAELFTR